MLVRLTVEYRREALLLLPGDLLEVDEDEASVLIESGVAVPVMVRDSVAAERR